MALEDILNLIKEEAESEGSKIVSKAEAEAEGIISSAREEADREEKRLMEHFRNRAEKEQERILDNTKLEIKKMILKEKRSLLDRLYKDAIDKFKSLSREDYISLVKKLLLENTSNKKEELIVSRQEKIITPAFIDSFNKENKGYDLSLSNEKGDFEGGFLLRAEKQQVDCTFQALIALIREEHEVELSRIYFGEEK